MRGTNADSITNSEGFITQFGGHRQGIASEWCNDLILFLLILSDHQDQIHPVGRSYPDGDFRPHQIPLNTMKDLVISGPI